MKRKIDIKKAVFFLILAAPIPFIVQFLKLCIIVLGFYIALACPDLTYEGDRTVPEEDVIHHEKLTLRDLRVDLIETDENTGEKICKKYFLIKGYHFHSKKIYTQLLQFCFDYFAMQNAYDEIYFRFYEESGKMPWFWNEEGHFPDLFDLDDNLLVTYTIHKGELKVIYTIDNGELVAHRGIDW